MITKEDLETGKKVWYANTKRTKVVELNFMHKVDGRKAYRFAPSTGKQLYIFHERNMYNLYLNPEEARERVAVARTYKDERLIVNHNNQPIAYDAENLVLNPPNLRDWAVISGFLIRVKYGRR
jgi:hypothetical protein